MPSPVSLEALSLFVATEIRQPHATVLRLAVNYVLEISETLDAGQNVSIGPLGELQAGAVVKLMPGKWPPNDDPGSFDIDPGLIGEPLFTAIARHAANGTTVHLAGLGTFHADASGAAPRFDREIGATGYAARGRGPAAEL